MKIIEINIIQFGKFKDRVFKLEDGFNVVRGENESGKRKCSDTPDPKGGVSFSCTLRYFLNCPRKAENSCAYL